METILDTLTTDLFIVQFQKIFLLPPQGLEFPGRRVGVLVGVL